MIYSSSKNINALQISKFGSSFMVNKCSEPKISPNTIYPSGHQGQDQQREPGHA